MAIGHRALSLRGSVSGFVTLSAGRLSRPVFRPTIAGQMQASEEPTASCHSIWRVEVSEKDPRPMRMDVSLLGENGAYADDAPPTLIRSRVFYLRGPLDEVAVSEIARRLLCDAVVEKYEISGQQSAVSSQRSAVSGQQSAVSGQQSAVSGQQSAVSRQPSAVSGQPSAFSDQRSAVSGQQEAVSSQQSAVSGQHSVLSPQSSVLSPQHSVLSTQSSVLSTQVSAARRRGGRPWQTSRQRQAASGTPIKSRQAASGVGR